ncbi:MAG: 50S ribosomal protein L32 [Elusimicrobia bacterium]|nr:50S ribosomal protein L32 [Elusimicrobiota bacterium]
MPNPYRKHSPRRRDSRRSKNWTVHMPGLSACKNCGGVHQPHTICQQCGFYGGKLIVPQKVKKTKKDDKEEGKG